MRRLRLLHHGIVVLLLGAAALAFAFRAGWVPIRFSPLPPLDLAQTEAYFADWRIAELGQDRGLCQRVLREPHITAESVGDVPVRDGCGVVNGVRMTRAGGARLAMDRVSCPLAAALALWLEHDVQPEAVARLGSRVSSVVHWGGFACRNIRGAAWLSSIRSEHATANAIDISGFVLADGRSVTVLKHWRGANAEATFLKAIHERACTHFRIVLGPEYNDLHKDHFHMDRGMIARCR